MTDLFYTAGRHWRVSSGMATAAIVTLTAVTVNVSSCPFLLGKLGATVAMMPGGFGRSGITEGMAPGGAAALMSARSVLIRDLLGKTPCASWKLLNPLGNVEHSVGYPRSAPQHPCKSWLLINSITEGWRAAGRGAVHPGGCSGRHKTSAPDVIPFHLTLLNYFNTEFTLYINTEVMQHSAPVVLLLILLVFWDRWSVDVKLHVQLCTAGACL